MTNKFMLMFPSGLSNSETEYSYPLKEIKDVNEDITDCRVCRRFIVGRNCYGRGNDGCQRKASADIAYYAASGDQIHLADVLNQGLDGSLGVNEVKEVLI